MKIFLKKPKPLPSAVLIGGGFSMQTIKYTFADGTTKEVEVTIAITKQNKVLTDS